MKEFSPEILNEITRRIVEAVHPVKIVLFGSYAWGQPTVDSDLDLFVVIHSSDQPAYRRARGIYRSLRGIGVPVDVVVQTHDEVERSRQVVTSLARKVMEEGKVLHG
ncbi:nucleotidyltransferase domain protein [bacterium BMS3Abin14]|nr:nucleotidyltransferase domain protein [bacterium BMS3Abin14]